MISNPGTIGAAIDLASTILSDAKIKNSRREAHLLMEYASNATISHLRGYPNSSFNDSAWKKLWSFTIRRAQHEPLAYILRSKEFWSLPFEVSRKILIPRPESETVIETILDFIPDRNDYKRLLDLGTGSGCLLGALLKEFNYSFGLGIDLDNTITEITRRNMKMLGLEDRSEIKIGNWGETLNGLFDIVVCNPPYIRSQDIDKLDTCIRKFEPRIALDGGKDGLQAYRILAKQFHGLLSDSGIVVVEFGYGQEFAVTNIMRESGLKIRRFGYDLGSQKRCLLATL